MLKVTILLQYYAGIHSIRVSVCLLEQFNGALQLHLSHSLTPSLAHSLTPSLAHSLTPSLAHSLTPSLAHSLTPSLAHSLTPSLAHSLTPSLAHSLTPSLAHSLTPSLAHSLTPSLAHSLTPSLAHSLTPSLARSLTHTTHTPETLAHRCLNNVLNQSNYLSREKHHAFISKIILIENMALIPFHMVCYNYSQNNILSVLIHPFT